MMKPKPLRVSNHLTVPVKVEKNAKDPGVAREEAARRNALLVTEENIFEVCCGLYTNGTDVNSGPVLPSLSVVVRKAARERDEENNHLFEEWIWIFVVHNHARRARCFESLMGEARRRP